jgi:hypothetical protein
MGVQIPLMIPRPHRDVGYCPEFTRDLMRGGAGVCCLSRPPLPPCPVWVPACWLWHGTLDTATVNHRP